MRVVEFKEQNTVYAKDQPQYKPLPCFKIPGDPQGHIIFCWKLSLTERLRVFLFGRVWHEVLTFNQSLQPQSMTTFSPFKGSKP